MQEQSIAIGETAGKIYRALQGNSGKSLEALKKEIKVAETLLNQGLGWLAREGKIDFQSRGNGLVLCLTPSEVGQR